MIHLTFNEFVYYGLLIAILAVYLTIYIKTRKEIISTRRNSTRWGIVISFAVIGIMAIIFKLVNWLPALISSGIACLIAYYVVFIKYKD